MDPFRTKSAIQRDSCLDSKLIVGGIFYLTQVYFGATASLTEWSACLTTNQELVGSIPGTAAILKADKVWNGVHPASRGQLGSYLIEK